MKRIFVNAIPIFIAFTFLTYSLRAQSSHAETTKETGKWFAKQQWLHGLKLQPHSSVDKTEFEKRYNAHQLWWDKAFLFLKENNLDSIKPGKYPIDGDNVYAEVTEKESAAFDKSKWHSHRKYSDIQYIIKGKDRVGVAPVSSLTIAVPYDSTKGDSQSYSPDSKGKYYIATQRSFFIFFPTDSHRPFIKVNGYDTTKRIIVKVHS